MLALRYLTHMHHKRQNRAFICENVLTKFKTEKTIQIFSNVRE